MVLLSQCPARNNRQIRLCFNRFGACADAVGHAWVIAVAIAEQPAVLLSSFLITTAIPRTLATTGIVTIAKHVLVSPFLTTILALFDLASSLGFCRRTTTPRYRLRHAASRLALAPSAHPHSMHSRSLLT
ncbi:hypothetical protein D9611_012279 [Ephemerocybe angulata]|uniref:Uncharacterized protein n=1 Tax=Ephemerocybe angulata TaxID=980116 RepID=A0A8H5ES84_9AGAR|nr:hypothetical protein D9611_012279 [Tulosesus angulatus]